MAEQDLTTEVTLQLTPCLQGSPFYRSDFIANYHIDVTSAQLDRLTGTILQCLLEQNKDKLPESS